MRRGWLLCSLVFSCLFASAQDAGKNAVGKMIDDSIRVNGQNKITAVTLNTVLHRINNINIDSLQAINTINGQKGLTNGIAQLISNLVPLSELPPSVDTLYAVNDSTLAFLIHRIPYQVVIKGRKPVYPPEVDSLFATSDSTLTFLIAGIPYNVLIRGSHPFALSAAFNGLSLDSATVQLGQPVGAPGNPANLTGSTEIPQNGNPLMITDSATGCKTSFNPGDINMMMPVPDSYPYDIDMTVNGIASIGISDLSTNVPQLFLSELNAFGQIQMDGNNGDRLQVASVINNEIHPFSGLFMYPGNGDGPARMYASSYIDPADRVNGFGTPRWNATYQQALVAIQNADDNSTTGPVSPGAFAALGAKWNTTTSPTLILGNIINFVQAGPSSKLLDLQVVGASKFSVDLAGNTGIGGIQPTARLHIAPGTGAPGTAPLKLASGPLLTTPEPGTIEFQGDKAYLGITTGPDRKEFTLNDAPLSANSVPFATGDGRLTTTNTLTYDPDNAALTVGIPAYSYQGTGVPPMDDRLGVQMTNFSNATSGNHAALPAGIFFTGSGWNGTTHTAQPVQFGNWVQIKTGTAAPVGVYTISSKINGTLPSIIQPYTNLFSVNSSGYVNILGGLYIGNMTSQASAKLHLAAGTAVAGTAPLKLTPGTLLDSAEDGAVEYDGEYYYGTVDTTQYILAKTLTVSATLNFPTTPAQSSSDILVTMQGVNVGDGVSLGYASTYALPNTSFTAWVGAPNTVTVRLNNYSSNSVAALSALVRIIVLIYNVPVAGGQGPSD